MLGVPTRPVPTLVRAWGGRATPASWAFHRCKCQSGSSPLGPGPELSPGGDRRPQGWEAQRGAPGAPTGHSGKDPMLS